VKLLSWNVNGFRAVAGKTFYGWLRDSEADVVCLQETKLWPEQLTEKELHPDGYTGVWNWHATRKGYSGVAMLFRAAPLSTSFGLPDARFRGEGRLVLLEYERFYLCNVYFPNGQRGGERLRFKLGYYEAFLDYARELRKDKPLVVCGDFNTAHKETDLARPAANAHTSGFLPEEREWMDRFAAEGFVDTFRLFEAGNGHYTWWSYFTKARERNVGWRIDYFFVSEELRHAVRRAWIEPHVLGSDHCPVGLELDL